MSADDIATAIGTARTYLEDRPAEARYRDSAAVAKVEQGLAVRVDGDGFTVHTDMTKGVGGGGSAPSPGWLLRAAVASCAATLITMRAAERGIPLVDLRVTVDSESDDRGILGISDEVPAGPLSVRIAVSVGSGNADDAPLREVIRWGVEHCPVSDAVGRAVPVELEIDVH